MTHKKRIIRILDTTFRDWVANATRTIRILVTNSIDVQMLINVQAKKGAKDVVISRSKTNFSMDSCKQLLMMKLRRNACQLKHLLITALKQVENSRKTVYNY